MGVDQSNNWAINFYYNQDLRSMYMNGLLNGGLCPGVFNGNFVLFTESDTVNQIAKIHLFIKKGTILNFSNGYKKIINKETGDSVTYEKDSSVGTYFIKATALRNIDVVLKEWDLGSVASEDTDKLLGPSRKKTHFIISKLIYNPEEKTINPNPRFSIVDINQSDPGGLYYTDVLDGEKTGVDDSLVIFDGRQVRLQNDIPLDDNFLLSWLCLGILNERPLKTKDADGFTFIHPAPPVNPLENRNSLQETYINNYKKGWENGLYLAWIEQHSFTARGLEDYLHDSYFNTKIKRPDIIFNNKCSEEYLQGESVYTGENIISPKKNLKEIYSIGNRNPVTEENNKIGFDFISWSEGKFELKDLKSSDCSLKKKDSSLTLLTSTSSDDMVVCDFSYLELKNELENNADLDLFKALEEKSNPNFKLKNFRWCAPIKKSADLNFSPNFSAEDITRQFYEISLSNLSNLDLGNHFEYEEGESNYLKNKVILPLDINTVNTKRLRKILEKTNILSIVLSYMRNNLIIDVDATSIIPVSISFRKLFNDGAEKKIEDRYSFSNYSDFYSSDIRINPANTLSFLDLQSISSGELLSLKTTPYLEVPIL